jgi:hypothetical protein
VKSQADVQGEPETHASGSAALLSASIASGGLVGAGLAILALQLPGQWDEIAVAVVPTLSASLALIIRRIASDLRRRHNKRLWELDRKRAITFADVAIPELHKALSDLTDTNAQRIAKKGIAQLERMKALALSATPMKRPWLSATAASLTEPE